MSKNLTLIGNLKKFRLITFDVTDTLLKFSQAPAIKYAKTAADFGYNNIDQNVLESNFKSTFKEMFRKYPNFGKNSPQMDWQMWWRLLVTDIFRKTDPNISLHDMERMADKLIKQYKTSECWSEIDGATELITKVKELGKHTGIISNFDPRLGKVIEAMDLPQFDFILTSYECGSAKPSIEMFQKALEMYSIRTDEALHIGNTLELDYVGARNAGWSSLLVADVNDEKIRKHKVNQYHVFKSLRSLLTSLETEEIQW